MLLMDRRSMSHGTMVNSKICSISAKKITSGLISNGYIKKIPTGLANAPAMNLCFCIGTCILLCNSGKWISNEVAAELAGSHAAVFRQRKTNDLANARVNDHPQSGWLVFPVRGRKDKSTSVL